MADIQTVNKRMQLLMNMSCLRLRGLPYSAVEKDIMDFLSIHADFVVGCVHIIYNVQGRPSGEAFLEMQSPSAAENCAKKLHLKHMGERYIEVFQCNVQDMMWMLAKSHADKFAAEHLKQLSINKNKKYTTAGNTTTTNCNIFTNSPSPPPIIVTSQVPTSHALIPGPITSPGFIPPAISPIPVCTSQYQLSPLPQLPPLPPLQPIPNGCFFPPTFIPHHGTQMCSPPMVPVTGHFVNPEVFQFPEFVTVGDYSYVPYTDSAYVSHLTHVSQQQQLSVSVVDSCLT